MGLTRKLMLRFGAVMGVLLVIGVVLVAFLTHQSRALEGVLRENADTLAYCARLTDAVDGVHDKAQQLSAAPKPGDAALLADLRRTFEEAASAQIANSSLPGERELSQSILENGRECFAQVEARLSKLNAEFVLGNFLPHYQQCRDAIQKVAQINLANLASVNAQIRSALLTIRNTVIALVLLGAALSVVLVIMTARDLTRPIAQLTASVRQVEKGDLDAVVQASQHDEIGILAEAFNAMAARLREFRRIDHERLLRTRQTTQTAIDSLPDAVAVIDSAGVIELANKTAQVHFALVPGANLRAIRADWAKLFLDDVIASSKPHVPDGYRSAIQLFDESGERFLLPRAAPMFGENGQVIGVTLALVEVTHLRRADEFKSGLISTVSHELKTPLTSIRMSLRMLLDKRIGELNPKQHKLLDVAKTDSERLVRTLEDMLTIGRVEAGLARLDSKTISVRDIVSRAVAPVQPLIAEKRITLRTQFDSEELIVNGDIVLLACALTNLLSNAVKYGPIGSPIDVRGSAGAETGEIVIAVSDQGPGVPEEYRERIFEKFFRIPTSDGPSGAGLGLAIAREIALLHGGNLQFTNNPGAGSTFTFRLPKAQAPVATT